MAAWSDLDAGALGVQVREDFAECAVGEEAKRRCAFGGFREQLARAFVARGCGVLIVFAGIHAATADALLVGERTANGFGAHAETAAETFGIAAIEALGGLLRAVVGEAGDEIRLELIESALAASGGGA